MGSAVVAPRLQSTCAITVVRGLIALHVESSQTRDQTHVPCTGRQILNPWTIWEIPFLLFLEALGLLHHGYGNVGSSLDGQVI